MKKLNVIWILGEGIRNYFGDDKYSRYKLFDKLAPEGVLFNNLITSVPSTVMSHSSMLTSQPSTYLSRTFADINFDVSKFPSLSHILKKNGHQIYAKECAAELYKFFKELFLLLDEKDLPKTIRNDRNQTSEDINIVLNHLLKKGLKEPFFLLLNYNNQRNTEGIIEQAIETMKKKGLFENSIFLFCPDHAAPDENRNPYERHDLMLKDANLLSPFFIQWPGCPKKIVNRLISTLDIVPTILDLLQLSSEDYNLKGNSILPLITGDGEYTQSKFRVDCRYIFQKERRVCIRGKEFKYITYLDKPPGKNEEFFDLSNDPDEKNNLILSEKYLDKIQEFKLEFEKTEEELVNFHLNYLTKKFGRRLRNIYKNKKRTPKKIFLLGSAHPLFIKAILKTINISLSCPQIDLVISPGVIEEKENTNLKNKINTYYVETKPMAYEHKKTNYNKENNPIFNAYSDKVETNYQAISYEGFMKKHSTLGQRGYDLVIVPLDNPYGAGHKELKRIVKELKTKRVVYVNYNMDFKKLTNWFLEGLRLINKKKGYYLTNPQRMLYEVKRYYLKEIKNKKFNKIYKNRIY